MKAVILAGGRGVRMNGETRLRPKPMIEIGDAPILWHIMKYYSHFGYNDFIICCGYKGYMIKEYFAHYDLCRSDMTFDFRAGGRMEIHGSQAEPWRVTLADTGMDTETGGRVRRVQKYIGNETFMLTYGDGLSDVDLDALLKRHTESGGIVTMTAVQPEGRYGVMRFNADKIVGFREKAKEDSPWINAGFMVMEPEVFSYLDGGRCILEREPLEALGAQERLIAYRHDGFWQCMDTAAEKLYLEDLWNNGRAPWKVWD